MRDNSDDVEDTSNFNVDNSLLLQLRRDRTRECQNVPRNINKTNRALITFKINSKQFYLEIKPTNNHEINNIMENLIGPTHET